MTLSVLIREAGPYHDEEEPTYESCEVPPL